MTTVLWCWLIGVLLPFVWAGTTLHFRRQQFGGPDLQSPREQASRLEGAGARADSAQYNAWEGLIVFSAANGAAIWAGVDAAGLWSTLAMVWVAARLTQGIFYVAGITVLRVLGFAISMVCSLWIFSLAIRAV